MIDAVESLSVPGTIEAVKLSAGVVTAHSAALHMAWSEGKPAFLLYDQFIKKTMVPLGPIGYMFGMNRANSDHMEFSEYSKSRFIRWVEKRG